MALGIALIYYNDTQMQVVATAPSSPGYFLGFRAQVSIDGGAWTGVGPPQGWIFPNQQASHQAYFTVAPGHVYQVRMTHYYGGGNWYPAGNITTNQVCTTPPALAAPGATATVDEVTLTRTGSLPYVTTHWRVERSVDGGAWTSLATRTAAQSTYVDSSVDRAKENRYRLVALADWSNDREGTPSPVVTVDPSAPPLAPTNLGPLVAGADVATMLTFQHNPVDGTPISALEIQHRADPGDSWTSTGKVASAEAAWELAASTYPAGTDMQWRASTWGGHTSGGRDGTGASPWSTTAVLALREAPTGTITSPDGSTWGSPTLVVDATYSSPVGTPMASWSLSLALDSEPVETLTGTGPLSGIVMGTSLQDGQTYSLTLTVTDGDGLTSEPYAVSVPVVYDPPPEPGLTATWHPDDGWTLLEVTVPEAGVGEVAVSQVTVERTWPGVGWTRVGTLTETGAITDFVPPTGEVVTYRAVALAETGAAATSPDVVVETTCKWLFINHGPGFTRVARLRSNIVGDRSHGREKTLTHYDGRALPVERTGPARTITASWSATIWGEHVPGGNRGQSTYEELVAAADAAAPVCVRDGQQRLFGSTGPVSQRDLHRSVTQVDMSLTVTHDGADL